MYDFSSKTALIIDDLYESRSFLRNHLANLGFKSAPQLSNIKDAIDRLAIMKPDVIVCDYYLGEEIDGQQFLEYIRKNDIIDSSVAFVMVTAEASYSKVAAAAEFVPDVYLLKPFSGDALEQRLVTAIERRQDLNPIVAMMKSGQWSEAFQMVDSRMKTDSPFKSHLMKLRGECLENLDIEAAFNYYTIVAKKGLPWAITGLARCNIVKDDLVEAKTLLSTLVGTGSPFVEAYDLLANISSPEEAVSIHQQSAIVIPSSNRFRKVAKSAISAGNFDLAEKSFETMMKKSKHGLNVTVEDQVARIKAIAGNGKVQEAEDALLTLREKLESGGGSLSHSDELELASAEVAVLMAEKPDNAREALLKAMAAEKMTSEQAIELARLGQEAGLIQESVDLLTRFLANNNAKNNVKIALKSSTFGDDYDILVEKADKDISNINSEAMSLAKSGKAEDAFAMLDRMTVKYHSNASILLNAAKVALDMIKAGTADDDLSRRAVAHLRAGIKLDPTNGMAQQLHSAYKAHGFSV